MYARSAGATVSDATQRGGCRSPAASNAPPLTYSLADAIENVRPFFRDQRGFLDFIDDVRRRLRRDRHDVLSFKSIARYC